MTGTKVAAATSHETLLRLVLLVGGFLVSSTAFGPGSTPPHRRPSFLQSTTATNTDIVSFLSPHTQVYIEDTDAYGVMYNANYLRAFERLLYRQEQVLCGPGQPKADWWVQSVTEQRFKGSPPLGGEFVVKGTLMEKTNDQTETWMCEMVSSTPQAGTEKPTVYNTAILTITASLLQQPALSLNTNTTGASKAEKTSTALTHCYYACRDEFDPTLSHRIPLRNVLNFFERARSDSFGGPDCLRRMEQQDGIVWVVTRVDQLQHCNLQDLNTKCTPAEPLTVQTTFVVKRGGMVVECHHALLAPSVGKQGNSSSSSSVVVAQGVVTIMALDAGSRRPTNQIPEWVKEKLNVKNGSARSDKIDRQVAEQQNEIEASMQE